MFFNTLSKLSEPVFRFFNAKMQTLSMVKVFVVINIYIYIYSERPSIKNWILALVVV